MEWFHSAINPKEWNFEIFKYIAPSQYHNGSPNSGIKIFIGENKKDFIYVHRSVSQIQDTRNGFIGATGQVHNDNFDKYEEQIMNIFKSIKLQLLTSEKVE